MTHWGGSGAVRADCAGAEKPGNCFRAPSHQRTRSHCHCHPRPHLPLGLDVRTSDPVPAWNECEPSHLLSPCCPGYGDRAGDSARCAQRPATLSAACRRIEGAPTCAGVWHVDPAARFRLGTRHVAVRVRPCWHPWWVPRPPFHAGPRSWYVLPGKVMCGRSWTTTVSFRFVSFRFVSFRFVSFRFK